MLKTNYLLLTAILITLLTLTIPFTGKGQSATDAYIDMNDIGSGTFSGTYYVFLSDTTNISQIETTLGTSDGATDILTTTFNYDITTGLPSGYSYNRQANKLSLGIGNYSEKNTSFGSVRIKNNAGTWSSPYKFITN